MTPKAWIRLRWLGAAALLLALLGGLVLRSRLGIDWSLESVSALVEGLGIWAPIGFSVLVAARSLLLLPSQLVLTAGGLAFGAAGGTVWGGLGLLANAVAIFAAVRWLGLESVRQRVPRALRRSLDAAGGTGGAVGLAVATGYPVGPIALYQAAAGLTRMSAALYLLAATVGCAARAGLYSSFGSSIVEGQTARTVGALALIVLSLIPLAHPRVRARLAVLLGRSSVSPTTRAGAPGAAHPEGPRAGHAETPGSGATCPEGEGSSGAPDHPISPEIPR